MSLFVAAFRKKSGNKPLLLLFFELTASVSLYLAVLERYISLVNFSIYVSVVLNNKSVRF